MSHEPIKQLLSSLTGFLPVEKLIPAHRQRFIFPFWHAVSDVASAHLSALYKMPSSAQFENDLDFLLKHFKSATSGQVEEHAGKKLKSDLNLFFPSFDDGLSECYHVIAPILKRKGIQAAFFINPLFVDNKQLFHRHKASIILNHINSHSKLTELKEAENRIPKQSNNKNILKFLHRSRFTDDDVLEQMAHVFGIDFNDYLFLNQPYMSLTQIRELQKDGFLIGAHGMDHREFFGSSDAEIIGQVSASMDFVAREINPQKKWFAFPFTDFMVSDSVFEKTVQAKLWDLSFGTAGLKDETMPNHIQRIPMESGKTLQAEKIIRAEYAWYAVKSVFGKNKVIRQ